MILLKQEMIMVDYNRQVQIKIVKVDGVEHCCTRPGYYYRKAAVGYERISQEEWEEAMSYSYMDDKSPVKNKVEEKSSTVKDQIPAVSLTEEKSSVTPPEEDFWDGYLP